MVGLKINIPDDFFEEETRCDHIISKDMKKVWAVELDLLNELLRVCDKYNLCIYASDGTLLGAVRHRGFIPWDDDIDMTMKRDDYEKLCEIAPEEFQPPYFFQTNETDPGSCRGHAQFRNSETTAIIKRDWERGFRFNQGIFIDIFPLDNVPDDPYQRDKFIEQVKENRNKALKWASVTSRYNYQKDRSKYKHIKLIISKIVLALRIGNPLYERYEKLRKKYNGIATEHSADLAIAGLQKKYYQKNRDFNNKGIRLPFEFLSIPVPDNYRTLLNRRYGNWEVFVKDDNVHGETFFDVSRSYREYINGEREAVFPKEKVGR